MLKVDLNTNMPRKRKYYWKILPKNKIFLKTISQTLPCIKKKCFINHNRFLINTQLRSLTPATLNWRITWTLLKKSWKTSARIKLDGKRRGHPFTPNGLGSSSLYNPRRPTHGKQLRQHHLDEEEGRAREQLPLNYRPGAYNHLFYLWVVTKFLAWVLNISSPSSGWETRWIRVRQTNASPHRPQTHSQPCSDVHGVFQPWTSPGNLKARDYFLPVSKWVHFQAPSCGKCLLWQTKKLIIAVQRAEKTLELETLCQGFILTVFLFCSINVLYFLQRRTSLQNRHMANPWKHLCLSKYVSKQLHTWVIFLHGGKCQLQSSQAKEVVEPRSASL